MKPVYRGLLVAAVQCAIVLSVAGKYQLDRQRLPRAWALAVPFDPNLFVRGRYVSMQLRVQGPPVAADKWMAVRLSAVDGKLTATPDQAGSIHISARGDDWVLSEPVAYFIPESVPDPSWRARGEELWVEVSVPAKGAPRPIALAIKKDGVMTPLAF